tara:strand:+ start:361 stop:720 length:360 start_codon:yes stop_codon:yes gene_type:complete
MLIPVQAKIYEPMYEYNDKKYIRVTIPDKFREYVEKSHERKSNVILYNNKLDDPLEGNVLKLKVPFRYRRVMCNVEGDKPVQSLERGDRVLIEIQFNGVWNTHEHSGYSWVLKYIKFLN